jgi:hypothetical protein
LVEVFDGFEIGSNHDADELGKGNLGLPAQFVLGFGGISE